MERLLIIQGTPFCNIDCTYCYLPDRTNPRRMTLDVFEAVLSKIVASNVIGREFRVCWHAGEPLVIPPAFYRQCGAILSRLVPEGTVRQAFQTNGTLIDEQWCAFFAEQAAVVGVSIDGPEHLNDRNRRDRQGRGTYVRVRRGIERLRAGNVPFGVICVLTAAHLDHASAMFDFFCELGPQVVSFNIDELEGVYATSSFLEKGALPRFRDFVREFLQLYARRKPAFRLANLQVDVLAETRPSDNHQVVPWGIVSVDAAGNVSTFSPELIGQRSERHADFILGNLVSDSFETIAAGHVFRTLNAEIEAGVQSCRESCAYFAWCGGGAPANKYFEHGTFAVAETLHCRAMKKTICDVNLELAEQEVDDILRARAAGPSPGG